MPQKRLREILTKKIISVSSTTAVAEVLDLMVANRISCVVVLEENRPVGIITERDIVHAEVLKGMDFNTCLMLDIMSVPVLTASENMDVYAAYNLLTVNRVRHLVVVDEAGMAAGIVTYSDIIEHLGYEFFIELRKVFQVMTKIVVTVPDDITMAEAAAVMADKSISCLVIAAGSRPAGILTERDVVRLLISRHDAGQLKVKEVMRSPVRTVSGDTPVLEAADIMIREKIRRLAVVDRNGDLVGLATQSDIVKGLESQYVQYLKRITIEKDLALEDTFRKLAEKTVYFDNILRSSIAIGLVATDLDGRIAYYNPAAERILGCPAREVIGRKIREVHRKLGIDLAKLDRVLAEIQEKKDHLFFFERDEPSGRKSLEARAAAILDKDGKAAGFVLTLRDITEQKRAEEKLRTSEELFRLSFENAKDAIFWADIKTGVLVNCNRAAERLLEKSREEIIGQHQTTLHPPEKAAYYADMFRRDIERKGASDNEAEVITRTGKRIPVRITASLTVIDGESLIQGIFRDISERKRVEEALRKSEKKYSTLVENSLTGIYIDQGRRIVFANKRFADIYGYRREELQGIEVWKLVHPEDRALTEQMRSRRLKGQAVSTEYEARGLTKNGETIWITRRNTRITYRGKPAVLGNIVDITEKKRAEEDLRNANKELQDFVRAVSHDLKNPLIAIQGIAARLAKYYEEEIDEKGRHYIEHINANAHRMALLISDLLTLSKVGSVVPVFQNVDANEMVKKIISVIRDRLDEKGIQVRIAENLPEVCCDEERIRQVFENLLVNAVKYMGGDNHNPWIEIGCKDEEEFYRFFIRDNGVGIAPKDHRRIFQHFQRLKETANEEGTGLGLAIVDRIISSHGGRIWVDSEKGRGATFFFTLPHRQGQKGCDAGAD